MYWFAAVALLLLRASHSVPQLSEGAHLGLESPADVGVKGGQAASSSSMIRTESSRSRKGQKHGGGAQSMFEVKASGELKYHGGSSGAIPDTALSASAMGKSDVVKDLKQSAGDDVAVVSISGDKSKEDEPTAHDASDVGGPQSAVASDSALVSDHETPTVNPDLSALPMEKLALLQEVPLTSLPVKDASKAESKVADDKPSGQLLGEPALLQDGQQANSFISDISAHDLLPGERRVGELLQEGAQASTEHEAARTKAEEGAAPFPIPGMGNVGDLAFRAMDMMLGTTGIIAEDYPFACICNAYGTCERDVQNTPCPRRAGQMAAARRSVSNGAIAVFLSMALAAVQVL